MRQNHFSKSSYGFTLIELLVVVSIIALLVSILLPALAKARDSARNVMCMVNLRSCGQGFYYYQDSHEGRVPIYDDATKALWTYIVEPYIEAAPKQGVSRGNDTDDSNLVTRCPKMQKGWDYLYCAVGTAYSESLKTKRPEAAFRPKDYRNFALLRDFGSGKVGSAVNTYTYGDDIHNGRHNVLFFDYRVESRQGPGGLIAGAGAYNLMTREYPQ